MADVIYGQPTDQPAGPPVVFDTPPSTDTIQLEAGPSKPLPNPVVAGLQASHAEWALSSAVPELKYNDYFQEISSGREDDIRRRAADKINEGQMTKTLNAVSEIANKRGGPVTFDEFDQIRNAFKPVQPHVVFEQAFGKKYIDTLYDRYGIQQITTPQKFDYIQKVISEQPELSEDLKEKASTWVSKMRVIDRLLYETSNEIGEEGFGTRVKNFLLPWIPGYTNYTFGAAFVGEKFDRDRLEVLTKPLEDMEGFLREKMKDLNPEMRLQYLAAMKAQSLGERTLNNVLPLLDATALTGAYKAGKSLVQIGRDLREANQLNTALKQVVKSTENTQLKEVTVAAKDGTGDLHGAAIDQVVSDGMKEYSGAPKSAIDSGLEELQPILNPFYEKAVAEPGGFGVDNVNKIREQSEAGRRSLLQRVYDVMKIRRIPAVLAMEGVVRQIMADSVKLYKGIENQIVGTSQGLVFNRLTNNHGFWYFFGNTEGEVFSNPVVAKNWANLRGWEQVAIIDTKESLGIKYPEGVVPKGAGYLVAKWQPLRETEDIVRNALLTTKEVQSPYSWLNSVTTWLRTPEETLSQAERKNRGVAEFVPQALLKEVKNSIGDIRKIAKGALSKSEWKEWERAVKASQHAPDPETKLPGYWYTPHELDDFYQRTFGRNPKQAEYQGYYAIQRAYEDDYILRNLRIHSDMARVGAEHHQIWFAPPKGDTVRSPWFSGVKLDKLPLGKDTILVVDGSGGWKEYFGDNPNWLKARKDISEKVENGTHKVVEVYNPDQKDLEQFSTNRVRYVVAPVENFSEKELPLFNLPRRGGGHYIYDYDYWISQAKIHRNEIGNVVKNVYVGDANFGGLQVRRMGQNYVKHLNAVRELIRENKLDEARIYNNTHLDIDWDKHLGWYQESKDPKGFTLPPRFDVNEPFFVRERGQNAMHIDKEGIVKRHGGFEELEEGATPTDKRTVFVDGTRRGSLARQNTVEFAGERDAHEMMSVMDEGSKGNPIYKTAPADIVDPITALNRGLSRIVSSFVMDDYKHAAVEHWIEEGIKQGIFAETDPKKIRYSPIKYFTRPEYTAGLKGEKLQIQQQMEANRWKIQQFLGTQDKVSAFINSTMQKLVDEIYGKFGPKMLPSWVLEREPGTVYSDVRSMVFHLKLGLFNVPQFFKQASTFANVIGMAGFRHAPTSAAAVLFHNWAYVRPGMLEALDRKMFELGSSIPGAAKWKLGEFKESYELAQKSGFLDGVHSHINLDAPLSNAIIQSKYGNFLNWGSVFFREGVQSTKIASWHTAYKEWREVHPRGHISDSDLQDIFLKARTYNHNMDRASAASFQTGLGSFAFQFKSYTLRLAELMTGKRLTPVQKARLFATHAGLYGVPLAVGLSGLPADDLFRPKAMEGGYVPQDNFLSTTFMEGGLATAVAFINGGGDLKKGKLYDFGQQFGPVGFTELTNHARTDSPMLDLVLGAAGSTFGDAIKSADPLWTWLSNAVHGRGNDAIGPSEVLTAMKEMSLGVARESSTIDRGVRYWHAVRTGNWLSKNGTYLGDTNFWDASYMTTFGLHPSDAVHANVQQNALQGREESEKRAEQYFRKMWKRAFTSLKDGDLDNSLSYRKLAIAGLTAYPREKWSKLIASTTNDYKTLVNSVDDRFYLQTSGLDPEVQEALMKAYRKRRDLRDEQHGR